jgi:copper chaperone CopZ
MNTTPLLPEKPIVDAAHSRGVTRLIRGLIGSLYHCTAALRAAATGRPPRAGRTNVITRSMSPILLAAGLVGCQTAQPRIATTAETNPEILEPVAGSGHVDEYVATLHVRGMSCPLCANNIDRQLLKIPGVERVSVNLGNGEVRVRMASSPRPTKEQLTQAIERSGFTLVRADMPKKGGE